VSEVLVVGSVALDWVKTPAGEGKDVLGGAAVYFSLAARLFARVRMLAVVGSDFPREHRSMLETKGIDLEGLETARGKTFRWRGAYAKDMNSAKTLQTDLNVFSSFRPKLSPAHKSAPIVFLANMDPELQWEVLSQVENPALVACDTMNYWIDSKRPALKELLSRVDILFLNDEEAKSLSGEPNNVKAAMRLREWGPSAVVIKKGEHGSMLMAGERVYAFPAYPLAEIKDPTGAGDSFAGGFMGWLASRGAGAPGVQALKRAMLYGSVLASYNVQEFSTKSLEALDLPAVQRRYKDYLDLLSIEDGVLDGRAV